MPPATHLIFFEKSSKFVVPHFHEFTLDCNEHLPVYKIWHDKLIDETCFLLEMEKLEKHGIVKVVHSQGNKGMNNAMSVNNYFIKCTSLQIPPLNKV